MVGNVPCASVCLDRVAAWGAVGIKDAKSTKFFHVTITKLKMEKEYNRLKTKFALMCALLCVPVKEIESKTQQQVPDRAVCGSDYTFQTF